MLNLGFVIITASAWVSLAVVYYTFVKWNIHKAYQNDIKEAIEKAIDRRINELSVDYFKRSDADGYL